MSNNPSQSEDQLFCLQFELQSLSALLVRSEAERWVPGFIWPDVDKEHRTRYAFALQFTEAKQVLDVACGCGFGSLMLAKQGKAASVLAADIDQDSIRYGQLRYPHEKITRKVMDVHQVDLSESMDVAVSFETIEHLDDPDKFLAKIYEALRPGGIFLVSTPIASSTTHKPFNPYHKIEWSYNDFQQLLKKKFAIQDVYVQSLEFRTNRIISFIKRVLRMNKAPIIDHSLRKTTVDLSKIFRGYQLVVCKKI